MKTLLMLLAVAMALAAAWFARENAQLRRARVRASPAPGSLQEMAVAGRAARRLSTSAGAGAVSAAAPVPASLSGEGAIDAQTAVRRLWADPEFRLRSLDDAIAGVEQKWGRFFLELRDMPPSRREALKALLAEQSVALAEASLAGDPAESEAERAKHLRTLHEQQEAALRSAMGETAYGRFDAARQMEPYRPSVDALVNGMRAQGLSIAPEQQEAMLRAYVAAFQAAAEANSADASAAGEVPAAELRTRQYQRLQQELVVRMSAVLDAPTYNAFLAAQSARQPGS